MKIRKVEDKPMVLHRKQEPKLHLSIGKKQEVHTSVKVKRKSPNGIKEKFEDSKSSVKVKNRRLKALAETGVRMGAKQIDGGEEIETSIDLMATVSTPMVEASRKGANLYRKKKALRKEQSRKRKAQNRMYSETEHTKSSIHAKQVKARNKDGKSDSSGKDGKSGKGKRGSASGSFVKSQMLASILSKTSIEQEDGQGGLIEGISKTAKAAALLLVKQISAVVTPFFLAVFGIIAICAVIVVAVLGVIYNSPLAIFFPQPETGYESPRTVLCEYYKEFNENILAQEDAGVTITYQNVENGAPVSNFNDTLMVYMVKYGTGQAGYVMDDEGKANLKSVFDEMNYMDDKKSTTTKIPAGESLGDVVATAYCPCSICCGPYANGITASGKKAKAKHTIAVDAYNPIVPMGTKVVIAGTVYTVEDTGDLNKYGVDFDIFYATHEACGEWGKQTVEAFLAEGNENEVEVTATGTLVHNLTYEDYIALGILDEDQISLLREMMDEDLWDNYYVGAGGQAVADLAMTKIGCRYDQDRRYEEGYYDCSSLVQRLYKEVGIELPATAGPQGKYCYENAMLVNRKDLKPGDLIFFSYEENDSFRNISHVAIYVGDGKMVHAANKRKGVILSDLPTTNIVFYARPY